MSKRTLEFPPMEVGDLTLSAGDRTALKNEILTATQALGSFKYLLEQLDRPVEKSVARSSLTIVESVVAKCSRITGLQLETEEDVDRRHRQIRELNMRVRELEAEVGSRASAEMLTQGVRALGQKLKHWWETEGLGLILMNKLSISEYGNLSVTFSCDIDNHRFTRHRGDEDWQKWLKSRGFELTSESHSGRDYSILDCDSSRRALRALILKTFPTAHITSIVNRSVYGTDDLELRDIEVIIYDLNEVWVLPDPAKEVD